MTLITEKTHTPDIGEISGYTGNPLFGELCGFLESEYGAQRKIEYGGDNILLGWNVKFRKAGRALCTLYPKEGFFTALVVIGPREKERARELLPQMSDETRGIYNGTKEGMGQHGCFSTSKCPARSTATFCAS